MPTIPKATHELAYPRERNGKKGKTDLVTFGVRKPKAIQLEEDPEWHDIAKYVWRSATSSGQYDYYQDSDIAILYSLCDDLSEYKKPKVNSKTGEEYIYRSGQMLSTIMTALQSLLLTEGDRRKVRLELKEEIEEKPDLKLVAMDAYRDVAKAS